MEKLDRTDDEQLIEFSVMSDYNELLIFTVLLVGVEPLERHIGIGT